MPFVTKVSIQQEVHIGDDIMLKVLHTERDCVELLIAAPRALRIEKMERPIRVRQVPQDSCEGGTP